MTLPKPAGTPFDVAVIGGGTAGATASVGLARLGYRVVVFARPQSAGVEGVSARTRASLCDVLGTFGSDLFGSPLTRDAQWGSMRVAANVEYTLRRECLAAALERWMRSSGVAIRSEAVRRVSRLASGGFEVNSNTARLEVPLVIDARGRNARRGTVRGPNLVALSRQWSTRDRLQPGTAVYPVGQGWAWSAVIAPQVLFMQLVVHTATSTRPKLAALMDRAHQLHPRLRLSLVGAVPCAAPVARGATASYAAADEAEGVIRIGDAWVAHDPLSGLGIQYALRSARVGLAAAHTLLSQPRRAPGVWQFLRAHGDKVWTQSCRTAAEWYRLQSEVAPDESWSAMATAYEAAASAAHPVVSYVPQYFVEPAALASAVL